MRPSLYRPIVLLFISILSSSIAMSQVLGEVLYSWDFANGLPTGWTNTSASNIGLWEYRGPSTTPNSSVGPRGTCAGANGPIASLTPENGFMIFDSNYWDDNVPPCGGLGTGIDPAPHTAWLTTGTLNFTGQTAVTVTFLQHYRLNSGTTKVQVSTNGGTTWVDGGTNPGLTSTNAVWASFNITSLVAGQSNVKLRFEFSGIYYWWQIDDVFIYSPNDNDIMLTEPGYTVNPTPLNLYNQLEYDQYPIVMIPPIRFRGKATNIGGQPQTNVTLNSKVLNAGGTVIHNQTSLPQNMSAGQQINFQSPNSYTPPATLGDYRVALELAQTQTDENIVNNRDTLDYTISPYTFARDEGPMEDVFLPAPSFVGQPYEIGNVYEGSAPGRKCTSIAVGIGEGAEVGSQIQAIVYNEFMDEVRAVSVPYTINLADLNEVGEEFTVVLQLTTPLNMYLDTVYVAMVKNLDGNAPFRIARSGNAPPSTCFVNYFNIGGLYFLAKIPLVRMNIFLNSETPGCTDPTAMNYVPAATIDDGSCRYPGCTIEEAINFDPSANWDDGSCIVEGCTDPTAINYNPQANVEDNSCEYGGCTNPNAINYDPTATNDDGSCIVQGCTDPTADNFDPEATEDDGTCFNSGCTDPAAANFDPNATVEDNSCLYAGCTNPVAINYNPNADIEDGSCLIEGCTDPTAANFDPSANISTATCEYPGCTDPTAANYNATANIDDGSCLFFGCTDPAADNFNPEADINDGSCFYLGCTDPAADNFDPAATIDDGSCLFLGCTDPAASNFDPLAQDDDGSCIFLGCTDPTAINFDPIANSNDGSCEYNSAFFSINVSSGCSPLTINVNNQSLPSENALCSFYLNDELVHVGCNDFQLTIDTPGEYTLEYILEIGTGTDSFSVNNIVVFAPPSAPSITYNDFSQSMETVSTAVTYVWSVDGVPISGSNAPSQFINYSGNIDNGNYTLTITDGNGCAATSLPYLVLIPEFTTEVVEPCAPAIVEINNITDLPSGAYCTITLGNGSPLEVLQPGLNSFEYENAGIFEINVTAVSGSTNNSVTQTIETSDGVIPLLTWNTASSLVQCTNCSANGTASWVINGEQQTGQGPFSDELGEIYQVFLTTPLGCTASSAIIINEVLENAEVLLRIFPNPASNNVTIQSNANIEKMEMYDMVGRLVFAQQPNSAVYTFDTRQFQQGSYLVVLYQNGDQHRELLQIQR